MNLEFSPPPQMKRPNGRSRFAYVTLLMLNDSYLPGVLLLAHGLRQQKTQADLVCLVTAEIGQDARTALKLLYDHVVDVEKIVVPHRRMQQRQDLRYVFTRLHALRLGADGDLGFRYEKVVNLDADMLPLRNYDHLFSLNAPAGILNESKKHLMEWDEQGNFIIPPHTLETGKWKWHDLYEPVCPHGRPIPAELTDRVKENASNMGVISSVLLFEPSMAEFQAILADLQQPETRRLVGEWFEWPDMQYLTLRWSGRWANVDARFSGLNGYPKLSVLFGTHYAGFKPWYVNQPESLAKYGRFEDFQFWFREYGILLNHYPKLQKIKRLQTLKEKLVPFVAVSR